MVGNLPESSAYEKACNDNRDTSSLPAASSPYRA